MEASGSHCHSGQAFLISPAGKIAVKWEEKNNEILGTHFSVIKNIYSMIRSQAWLTGLQTVKPETVTDVNRPLINVLLFSSIFLDLCYLKIITTPNNRCRYSPSVEVNQGADVRFASRLVWKQSQTFDISFEAFMSRLPIVVYRPQALIYCCWRKIDLVSWAFFYICSPAPLGSVCGVKVDVNTQLGYFFLIRMENQTEQRQVCRRLSTTK